MSRFYLIGRSDTRKKGFTSRGHRWIDLEMGYDPNDYNKIVNVRLNTPDPDRKATLWVNGKIVWKED